jgi:Tol biopolymer transport system component
MYAVAGSLVLLAAAGCGSDSTAPDPLSRIPDFIYVSDSSGASQLYTWHDGVSTLFPASVAGDIEPQSAAGKVVFTSYRISPANPEIYVANIGDSSAVRLTTQAGTDHQPSLSPDGATVVFSTTRSGTSRIWTMGTDGSNPAAFNTGTTGDIPESEPRYSPSGDRILFSSPRTNITQLWIIPATGGAATQVTHELNGAFFGSWSADGKSVFYVDGIDRTRIHNVDIATGDVTDYVTGGTDVGDAACTAALCLVVTNATGLNRDILAYVGSNDSTPLPLLNGAASEYQPAILHK